MTTGRQGRGRRRRGAPLGRPGDHVWGRPGVACGPVLIPPAGREGLRSRFRWLTARRSTVAQPGPVHTGLTEDPDAVADRLLVLPIEG